MRRLIIEVSDQTGESLDQTAAVQGKSAEELAAAAVTRAYRPIEIEDEP